MNKKQMEYLYNFGTYCQLETVKLLALQAEKEINGNNQRDLFGLIRWVLDYDNGSEYMVFFTEFCKSIDRSKNGGEVSTVEAIRMQEEYYGNLD